MEEFHGKNPEMAKLGLGLMTKERFSLLCAENTERLFTLLSQVHKNYGEKVWYSRTRTNRRELRLGISNIDEETTTGTKDY